MNIDKNEEHYFQTKKDIEEWLYQMNICKYTIYDNLIVDVHQDVILNIKTRFKHFPVKFGIITGDFNCSHLGLTTLTGCPTEVQGSFHCDNNKLTSLNNCPISIWGDFDCSYNLLINLKGFPIYLNGSFYCNENKLTSLEYMPEKINGSLIISFNSINSLKGCPKIIMEYFDCGYNNLTSLEYSPEYVNGYFNCSHNKLKTLMGLSKKIGGLDCSDNELITFLFLPESIKLNLFVQHNKINENELVNFNSIVGGEIYNDFNLSTTQFLLKAKEMRVLSEKETLLNTVSATERTFKKNKRI